MRLPYVGYTGNQKLRTINQFGGYCHNLIMADNEFSDMKNISDRFYPAIASRAPRGAVMETIENCNALYWKNGLFYVSGTNAYYKGVKVGTVSDTKKQLAGIGAYIVIMPDKLVLNTSNNEWMSMEKTFTSVGTVKFEPLTLKSVFTKITATGIQNFFHRLDGVTISGSTNAAYNKTTIINEIGTNYIVVSGVLDKEFTQTSAITVKRTAPDMDFICESNNRIWGCSSKNHEIYGSKLGDPLNWNCFEGISTDSYAASVGSDGDFTGCIGHMGYCLFFKEQSIHKLFGNKPSNFQINDHPLEGVRKGCAESLEIVNETLYYVGRTGIYAYDGSTPNSISGKLGELRLMDAVSCQQDSKLYVSASDGQKKRIYVYNPETRIWDIEDEEEFCFASYGEGRLYYVSAKGDLRTVSGDAEEIISWYLESGDIIEQSMNHKFISKLLFNFWLSRGSIVNIYIRWDDDKMWEHKGTVSTEWNRTYPFPIIPRRCSKFRFRLEGTGQFKLLGIGRYSEEGSEVLNGIVKH